MDDLTTKEIDLAKTSFTCTSVELGSAALALSSAKAMPRFADFGYYSPFQLLLSKDTAEELIVRV